MELNNNAINNFNLNDYNVSKFENQILKVDKNLKHDIGIPEKTSEREKLKDAAKGFESVFVNILLSQMRKTVDKSELIDGGNAQEIFEQMFDEEISKEIAKRGDLGIADSLFKEFQRYVEPAKTEKSEDKNENL